MENNSDKEMRDKLQQVEFPFDPKAWDQMESMLNEDRKPRAFFWWWFGGVAACLLLATAIIGYYQFTHTANTVNTSLALNNPVTAGKNETPANSNAEPSAQHPNSTSANANSNVNTTSTNSNSAQQPNSTPATQNSKLPTTATLTERKTTLNNQNHTTPLKAKFKSGKVDNTVSNTSAKSTGAKDPKKNANHKANGRQSENGINQQAAISSNANIALVSGSAANETLAQNSTAESRSKLIDPISMDPILAFQFPDANDNIDPEMKKHEGEDVNLKKLNKKVFNYSLGVMGNVSGTTLGSAANGFLPGGFNTSPSFMVGLTHDFMFFKRFAITNSILFSQTSFTVNSPKTSHGEDVEEYSSKITELAIPIGIKVYAISKPKFRFYVAACVINHIKLKETFNYIYNSTNLTGSSGGQLPTQTQFGGGQVPALFANSLSNSAYYSTSDFSINHASRYYASFNASAGAEFIVNKHFVIFAESLFYMSLQKVGVQDKNKYNLGLSAGFRYQF